MVGEEDFVRIVRGITGSALNTRQISADESVDLADSYSLSQVRTLCGVLCAMAVLEQDRSTLEAQLHALSELGGTGFVRPSDVEMLRNMDRSELTGELSGYLDDLLEED